MTATFLVEIEINDPSELTAMSDDILDAVESAGFPVLTVKPWQRQTLTQTTPAQTGYPLPPPVL